MVVAMGLRVPVAIHELGHRHRALVVSATDRRDIVQRIDALRTRLVVVYFEDQTADACELVGALARGARRVTIVAIAGRHSEAVELRLRAAGAQWYAPGADSEVVGPLLETLSLKLCSRREPVCAGTSERCVAEGCPADALPDVGWCGVGPWHRGEPGTLR